MQRMVQESVVGKARKRALLISHGDVQPHAGTFHSVFMDKTEVGRPYVALARRCERNARSF